MPWGLTHAVGRSADRRRIALELALLIAGVAGFALLAASYDDHPLATLDREVARWVARSMPTWAEWLARPPSWLGGWIGLAALGAVALVVLVRDRSWLDLGFLVAAFAGSRLAVAVLKAWFDRPRPAFGSAIPLPSSPAFPSGHAAAGVASLGAVAVLASERLPSRRARVWLWVVVAILGLAIGASRIVLDVHYVTDVLAGWCLGLAWLSGCLLVREAVGDARRIRRAGSVPSPRGRDGAEHRRATRGDRGPARLGS